MNSSTRWCILTYGILTTRNSTNCNFWWTFLVEVDLIDVGIEVFIVRTKGIQNIPNHFESLVIIQCFLWLDIIRHDDWNDNIAVLLSLEGAHHATY